LYQTQNKQIVWFVFATNRKQSKSALQSPSSPLGKLNYCEQGILSQPLLCSQIFTALTDVAAIQRGRYCTTLLELFPHLRSTRLSGLL